MSKYCFRFPRRIKGKFMDRKYFPMTIITLTFSNYQIFKLHKSPKAPSGYNKFFCILEPSTI